MPEIYLKPSEVVEQILADHKEMTGIELKSTDLNNEVVIKAWTVAGSISQLRAQLRRVFDDFFPASSSVEGLVKHLAARSLPGRAAAQSSTGTVRMTGSNGTVFGTGKQIRRNLDGKVFVSISSGTVSGGSVDILFQSLLAGQDQNIDTESGEAFTLITPVANIDSACTSQSPFLSGRDQEKAAEMLARIVAHDQGENTGGNLDAYEEFARAADSRVVSARAIHSGAGTVALYITSGTTDIEAAVEAGDEVLRLPASDLVDAVQAYVEKRNPVTDEVTVAAPSEQSQDVTVTYSLFDETLRTSVDAEIDKITAIYLYSALPGDVIHPSDLERAIDEQIGHLISERRVSNFGGGSPGYTVPNAVLLKPGTITKASF